MRKYWTCQGDVSGRCGHLHRSARTAVLCCERHQRQAGGSDRRPVAVTDRQDAAGLWELKHWNREAWDLEMLRRYEATPQPGTIDWPRPRRKA